MKDLRDSLCECDCKWHSDSSPRFATGVVGGPGYDQRGADCRQKSAKVRYMGQYVVMFAYHSVQSPQGSKPRNERACCPSGHRGRWRNQRSRASSRIGSASRGYRICLRVLLRRSCTGEMSVVYPYSMRAAVRGRVATYNGGRTVRCESRDLCSGA